MGRATLGLALALVVSACAATTKFEETTRAPSFRADALRSVLVIAIGKKPANEKLLETWLEADLTRRGARVTTGNSLKTHAGPWTEAELRKVVADGKFDSVLLTRLLSVDKTENSAAPERMISGVSYDYYGFYVDSVALADTAGAMDHEKAIIESRIFDVPSGQVVWSARSSTRMDNTNTQELIREFAAKVAEKVYAAR